MTAGSHSEITPGMHCAGVWVDGTPTQTLWPLDRGLHFGDGLFETIACLHGRPRFLSLHLERLCHGCATLSIPLGGVDAIRAEIEAVARESDRAIIKLLVTRGAAVGRGYAATGSEKAMRITIRYAWPPDETVYLQDGVKVRTLGLRLGENPRLAGLKHCNRLEQILARRELSGTDCAEGLLFSSSGKLVSGTMSNVFIARGSTLQTPLIDMCGVAGVMRRVVLREAAAAGIDVQERLLSAGDLLAADEVFLTNARVGIWPVRALNERTLIPGAITRHLLERLTPLLEEPADA